MVKESGFFWFETPQKKKRVTPGKSERNIAWKEQKGKCAKCPSLLGPHSECHHKDGDPSNWKPSNLELLCLECHKHESDKQRAKKVQKRRREKEEKEKNPYSLFSTPPKKRGRPKKKFIINVLGKKVPLDKNPKKKEWEPTGRW